MPNWNSRLSIKYNDGSGEQLITPIESFQPTFAMNAEALNSIEATHIGVVYMPEQISFSISVKALGTATAQLTKLALSGTPFKIVMEEVDEGDAEWSLAEVLLDQCIITNASPTNATISGAPSATFSGFSLAGKVRAPGIEGVQVGAPISE
ncbi:MAG: hypothetical protein RL885_20465 [Planctomycetota bacterium]